MLTNKSLPPAVGCIPGFWERLHSAQRSFLGLDYDGTLAPFSTKRMEAYPLHGTIEIISKISDKTGGSLAVISGRPLFEVLALMGELEIILVGSHGQEIRFPDKRQVIKKPTPQQSEGLDMARARFIADGLSSCIEIKDASIAVHTRGLSSKDARYIKDFLMAELEYITRMHDLELKNFNGGVELRCKGIDKGEALRSLLSLQDHNTFCVYIGDDETDEDAFRAINGHGIGIKVGKTGDHTDAQGFLPNIASVQQFLKGWLDYSPDRLTKEMPWNQED